MPTAKKIASLVVKIGISGTLLAVLLSRVDRESLVRNLTSIDPLLFACVFAMYVGCQWVSAGRWRILLRASGIKISIWRLFSFNMVGMFFNNFLPTAIGGDVVRSYDLYRHTRCGKEAVATVFMDRFTGFSALLGVAAVAAFLGHRHIGDPRITWSVISIFLIYGVVMLLLFWERLMRRVVGLLGKAGLGAVQKKVDGVYGVVSGFRSSPAALVQAIGISIILQILVILAFYVLSLALHLSIPIRYFFIFSPIIWASSMLPSLGGLGIREFTGVYFFTKVGVEQSQALGLSFMWTIMLVLLSLVGGFIFMLRRSVRMEDGWEAGGSPGVESPISEPADRETR